MCDTLYKDLVVYFTDQERLMTFDNEGLVKTLKFLATFERAENQSDPYFYLMIWAILMMNLQDIAKFFWQHCKVMYLQF